VAGLGGPDVEGIESAARALARPVLAAGGIRGVDDVVALRALGPDVVEGVVVGRALYEGLDLADLLAAVA
jgi:phosphoribosylformimino-5-aminoimidazole carboxamide ribonucleotide (ProFAR) isomerase